MIVTYKKNMETYMDSKDLINNIEAKEIQIGEPKVDETGRMVFEDGIDYRISHADLMFIWNTIKDLLDANLIPPMESEPTIKLMGMIAERESEVYRNGFMFLPINYFVGMWHALNTGRKFDIYSKALKKANKLDQITMKVAEKIDEYHRILKPQKENMSTTKKQSLASFKKVVDELKQVTDKTSKA